MTEDEITAKRVGDMPVSICVQISARHLEAMRKDGRSRRAILARLLDQWISGGGGAAVHGLRVEGDSVAPPAPVVACEPTPEELESREESQRKAAAKMDAIEAALEKRGLTLWDYSSLSPEDQESLVPLSERV